MHVVVAMLQRHSVNVGTEVGVLLLQDSTHMFASNASQVLKHPLPPLPRFVNLTLAHRVLCSQRGWTIRMSCTSKQLRMPCQQATASQR